MLIISAMGVQRMEWIEMGLELSFKDLSQEKERKQAFYFVFV